MKYIKYNANRQNIEPKQEKEYCKCKILKIYENMQYKNLGLKSLLQISSSFYQYPKINQIL
jgi:hypothetical protein